MTVYRFRFKRQRETAGFWRDIEIGVDRTLAELGETFNEAAGLDGDHFWFFGTNRDFWGSSVKYLSHREYASRPSGGPMWWDEDVFDASETALQTLGLGKWDCLCYLFDYVANHRFYGILHEVRDADRNTPAAVVREKGELRLETG